MKKIIFFLFAITAILTTTLFTSYRNRFTNSEIDTLSNVNYGQLKSKIITEYAHAKPGKWGEFVQGVNEDIVTNTKIMAFTFDACGTKYGDQYDNELVAFLNKEHIPATMFVTGLWIDANTTTFNQLIKDTLFEIENHGLNHLPCAISGETEYGIKGTLNVGQAFDELELNNRKIKALTGRRPKFFRSPTAYADEACVKVAGQLGLTTISFDILSGDAVPYTPAKTIAATILQNAKDGAIVIMHMNHPKWYTYEALEIVIPELRKQGYTFVKLDHRRLVGNPKRKQQ
jgi:peptidoglycan/xylan/chitin deacetylase (PgdA/CDA1 family)